MVGGSKRPHGHSLCARQQRRSGADTGERTDRAATRRDPAQATPLITALQRESRLIPIVFASVADPIGSGFVASLPRPGGNITGVMLYEASVSGKWLAMLKEIAPRLKRAALVTNPKTAPYYNYYLRAAESVSPSLGINVVPSLVENSEDLERTIGAFARTPNGGLLLSPDASTQVHRDLIIALAARYSLPAVYWERLFVAAGGLMSYGADYVDMYRQAASYVDRILGGDQVRNDRQPQNGEGARPARAAGPARGRRRGDRMSAPAASWCDPAGGSPAQVRSSVRLVASVARPLATVGAKRTQRLHGVWD